MKEITKLGLKAYVEAIDDPRNNKVKFILCSI